MITPDELSDVPLLAGLPAEALAYVAGAVEDIRLVAGEYFAHEGDERALFIVMEGHAEITKVVNGEERVIGERTHGMLFGEVPMTLSTKFPASGRATVPARILRLGVAEYHALASMAPAVTSSVAEVARTYLNDLQSWAAVRPEADATLIGPRVDPAVRELATFLTRNQVAFDRVTPGDGDQGLIGPVLETRNGRRLTAPTLREAASAVGLQVSTTATDYDVVILGGGSAGSRRRSTPRPRACIRWSSSAWRPAGRPARPAASRTTRDFPTASRATSWRAGPWSRPSGSAPRSS